MAKTGPQRYPGASTAYWHQSRYGGSAMESNVGVIHTTEGTSVPSYGGGASAPNFTALPDIPNRRLRWYQHFDFDVSSRALVNRAGGVDTNTLNAVQIELVGTCDPKYRTAWGDRRAGRDYLFWPDAPDWALAELAKFVRWAHEEHGVQLRSTVTWTAYPSSYGATSARLSGSQWQAYYGWLGHQHVPENSHGDPGNLDMTRVLQHARGTTEQEDDPMAGMTAEDITRAVWLKDHIVGVPEGWGATGNTEWKPASILIDIGKRTRALEAELKAQRATIDKLADAVGTAGQFDPEVLKREIREAIESITVRLDTTEGA